MTGRDTRPPAHIWTVAAPGEGSPVDTPLPQASVGGMAGLLEILVAHGGREDLPELAHELTFEVDDLLPLVDAAQVLGLAEVDDADLQVTDDGRTFVAADILESKQIFARRARERAPLVRAICNALETTKDGNLGEGFFLDLLRRGLLRGRGATAAAGSPSTGAATASCSTSTPIPGSSPSTIRRPGPTAEGAAAASRRLVTRRPW